MERVVPLAMPGVAGDREVFHLPVADLDAGRVGGGIELGGHSQPGGRGGGADQVDDRLVAGQGPAPPVPGDLGEQAGLYFVPLSGTPRQGTDADFQAGPRRPPRPPPLPRPAAASLWTAPRPP